MDKKTNSLLFKIGAIFFVFTVITLLISGITTYINQMKIYKRQCEDNIRKLGTYLETMILNESQGFRIYQDYFLSHYQEIEMPINFTEYETAKYEFEKMFAKAYPGKTFGVDVQLSELPEEIQHAYLIYIQEYWVLTFEGARDSFGLPYAYYLIPNEKNYHVIYMIDGERTSPADHVNSQYENAIHRDVKSDDSLLYLGDEYYNDPEIYNIEWEAWFTGNDPTGYQVWDNSWGHTYAYYTPLIIDGVKMGLIGTEIEVSAVNHEILRNALRQILGIGIILVFCILGMLWVINKLYISKLSRLQASVRMYSLEKDSGIAASIEKESTGKDEISSLGNQIAAMILELENYMRSLVETTNELSATKQEATAMSELAQRDALTGIRNKTAYDNEIRRLEWSLAEGNKEFGIVMIDLNFLKRINDTYGHEQGNIAIKKLCNVVCTVFEHSPVFRIGGDEFVVILENRDLRNSDDLLREFNEALDKLANDESLEPWERISAAVGAAYFNPAEDDNVSCVFKRADKEMYRRKKEMKAL